MESGKRVAAIFHQNLNMAIFLLFFVILLIVVLCATLSKRVIHLAFKFFKFFYSLCSCFSNSILFLLSEAKADSGFSSEHKAFIIFLIYCS